MEISGTVSKRVGAGTIGLQLVVHNWGKDQTGKERTQNFNPLLSREAAPFSCPSYQLKNHDLCLWGFPAVNRENREETWCPVF